MPRDQEGAGDQKPTVSSEHGWEEVSDPEDHPRALTQAIRNAVDDANQPDGALLKIDIYVRSVGDPDVGAYKVIVTPL